jgi:hypothetical protein
MWAQGACQVCLQEGGVQGTEGSQGGLLLGGAWEA